MLKFAIELAKHSGKILDSSFGKVKVTNRKERKDIVTEMDLKSEKYILKEIQKKFPSHTILSEEKGKLEKNSEYSWIIDPLDGTVNYTSGLPLYSVSIGLVHKGKPFLGVVYAPYLNELFYAQRGKGAYLNGKKISPSKVTELENAVIQIGFSAHYSEELLKKNWLIAQKLTAQVRGIRAWDSGALTSCYIACGRFDGKISIKTDPFGNAASTVIIEEAGGVVSDFEGKKWNENMKTMICSNKKINKQIKDLVNF